MTSSEPALTLRRQKKKPSLSFRFFFKKKTLISLPSKPKAHFWSPFSRRQIGSLQVLISNPHSLALTNGQSRRDNKM